MTTMYDTMPELDTEARGIIREAEGRLANHEFDSTVRVNAYLDDPKQLDMHFGTDLFLRDDEVICPVTNLAYYKGLNRSPYLDERGDRWF